jgi:hypothetical protein
MSVEVDVTYYGDFIFLSLENFDSLKDGALAQSVHNDYVQADVVYEASPGSVGSTRYVDAVEGLSCIGVL